MYYDSSLNAFIDPETGETIPFQTGDQMPLGILRIVHGKEGSVHFQPYELAVDSNPTSVGPVHLTLPPIVRDTNRSQEGNREQRNPETLALFSVASDHVDNNENCPHSVGISGNQVQDDWTFARALQAMEFEIESEVNNDGDFVQKEQRAGSTCRRQMLTLSCFLALVQICIMIAMFARGGITTLAKNSMLGPPVTTLVIFGAKQAALEVYRKEWWRLISAWMLHAGVFHIVPNVFIQLRVGGYLELVFGTPAWFMIYVSSGTFGNILSSIFEEESVGVGSSGALMGMLTAWIIWIIFRWRKIPLRYHNQRNMQLVVVVFSVVFTLALSFAPYVDWAAHLGGSIQGLFWGAILLSKELDVPRTRHVVRIVAFSLSAVSIIYASYHLAHNVNPGLEYVEYFDENDDWHHHRH